jgi:hypothetical protein
VTEFYLWIVAIFLAGVNTGQKTITSIRRPRDWWFAAMWVGISILWALYLADKVSVK